MEQQLIEIFSKYVNLQFYSAYQYFAMSTYFDEIFMECFSKYMKRLAKRKLCLAQEIYDYLILRNANLTFLKIDELQNDWKCASDIFSRIKIHEEYILNQTKMLYLKAKEADDISSMEFVLKILNRFDNAEKCGFEKNRDRIACLR